MSFVPFEGLVRKSQSVSDSFNICCPFCEMLVGKKDTSYHLNFNTKKNVYRCPRCGSSGSLSHFKELNFLTEKPKTVDELRLRADQLMRPKKGKLFDLEKMSWALDQEKTPFALDYLTKRGFTLEDIRKYNLRVGIPYWDEEKQYEVKKWSGRIIFPFMRDEECIYLVGRSYVNADPKYLNSEGSKLLAVYNIQNARNKCIVCEGILSSISAHKVIGLPTIAILGKSLNNYQASMIRNQCSEVYLSLDGDTQDRERQLICNTLQKTGLKVWRVDLPVIQKEGRVLKDPDDLKEIYADLFGKAYLAPTFQYPSHPFFIPKLSPI